MIQVILDILQVKGYYLFTVAIQIEHASNTVCLPLLYKNGSEWAQGNASTGYIGVYPSTRATWMVPMNGSSRLC